MNFRSLHKFILALAAPLLLGACSDSNDDIPSPIEEDFEGIMINVPTRAASSLTRGDLETGEGKVNNLTVIAYKLVTDAEGKLVTDAEGKTVSSPTPSVKSVSTITSLTPDYQQVPMPLAAGTYHIYVVANVTPEDDWSDKTTKTKWEDLTETELQALEINTAPSYDPENLPMTCNYLAIRKTPSTANTWGTCFEKGEVKIDSKKTTKIYADLTFAVAKVRYSIVNGKLPFLKMADNENSRVTFLNYAKTSSLMTHKEEISEDDLGGEGLVGKSGTYYEWTIKDYDNAKGPDDEDAFAANMVELADPAKATTWCFRGTAYVPERLFKEVNEKVREITTDNPTKIKFNFSEDVYSDKAEMEFGGEVVIPSSQTGTTNHTHKGIIRGVVYEVKAFTTEKEITLKVRVRPWAYEKYTWEL